MKRQQVSKKRKALAAPDKRSNCSNENISIRHESRTSQKIQQLIDIQRINANSYKSLKKQNPQPQPKSNNQQMQSIYKNLKNLNFKALNGPKVVSRNSTHAKNLTTVNGDSASIKITESGHQKSTTKVSGQLKTAFQTQAQPGQNA